MNKDLTEPTPGERLWLWRRRQVSPTGRSRSRIGSGMSQEEAAVIFGVTHQKYHDAESDRLPERDIRMMLSEISEDEEVYGLTLSERSALARRRAGWSLGQAKQEFGASRVTYLERERKAHPSVINFWEQQGFSYGRND